VKFKFYVKYILFSDVEHTLILKREQNCQYFGFFGYFMEYNTARSIPILFLVEYRIPWNTYSMEYGIPDGIGIPDDIGIQVEFRILWNTAYDIIL
jgi:hypothetical protein